MVLRSKRIGSHKVISEFISSIKPTQNQSYCIGLVQCCFEHFSFLLIFWEVWNWILARVPHHALPKLRFATAASAGHREIMEMGSLDFHWTHVDSSCSCNLRLLAANRAFEFRRKKYGSVIHPRSSFLVQYQLFYSVMLLQ